MLWTLTIRWMAAGHVTEAKLEPGWRIDLSLEGTAPEFRLNFKLHGEDQLMN